MALNLRIQQGRATLHHSTAQRSGKTAICNVLPAPWASKHSVTGHVVCHAAGSSKRQLRKAELYPEDYYDASLDHNEDTATQSDDTASSSANSPNQILGHAAENSSDSSNGNASTATRSVLSTALTEEELLELQHALTMPVRVALEANDAGYASGIDDDEDDGILMDDDVPEGLVSDGDDRERVYLVGVDIWGPAGNTAATSKQHQAYQQIQNGSSHNSNSSSGPGVSVQRKRKVAKYTVQESLQELARLADTAGLRVLGSTYQSLQVPNNSTYIGSGKVAEVARAVRAYNVETVIFDCELAPGQLRNLEQALGGKDGNVRVCDRTALILDIFSQRAATREGKLQVELAQVEYQLPRLTRMWTHLDRVGGGGQVKGAGEKQIEMDKRLLRDRLASLRKELEAVRSHRRAYRERRAIAPIPVVALVGYTNAGKSTLLNRLTDAGVLAEDKLFATLDPTTRRIRTRGNRELLLTDTVGFIQKLPTELVAAFRATLEEVQDASVLLHLVDISHPNAAAQCEAVLQVLDDLGVSDIPLVTAWNKLDACADPTEVRRVAAKRKDTVCLSGMTGEGVNELLDLISQKLAENLTQMDLSIPYSAGHLLDEVHRAGEVIGAVEYTETGTKLTARVPPQLAGRLREYSVSLDKDAPTSNGVTKLLDQWDGAEANLFQTVS